MRSLQAPSPRVSWNHIKQHRPQLPTPLTACSMHYPTGSPPAAALPLDLFQQASCIYGVLSGQAPASGEGEALAGFAEPGPMSPQACSLGDGHVNGFYNLELLDSLSNGCDSPLAADSEEQVASQQELYVMLPLDTVRERDAAACCAHPHGPLAAGRTPHRWPN